MASPPSSHELKLTGLIGTLRCCQLFSGLSSADLETIAGFSTLRAVAKDAYLFHEGDVSEGFYVIQKGAINVHRVSATGKEQVIYVFRAGESLAEASLASERGYPASGRAVEASSVVVIPKAPMLGLLARRPDLALRMLGSMSQHLRVLVGLVDDLTLKDVETRFVNWLLKRTPAGASGPAVIELGSTKRVLAAELATSSETLSRTFAKLRHENLIEIRGATVRVASVAALQARFRKLLGEA